jgi:hypothetical protein
MLPTDLPHSVYCRDAVNTSFKSAYFLHFASFYDYESLARVIISCCNLYVLNYGHGTRMYIFPFVLLSSNKLFPTATGSNDRTRYVLQNVTTEHEAQHSFLEDRLATCSASVFSDSSCLSSKGSKTQVIIIP